MQRHYMLYRQSRIPLQAPLRQRPNLVFRLNLHFQASPSHPSPPINTRSRTNTTQRRRNKRRHNLQLHPHPRTPLPRQQRNPETPLPLLPLLFLPLYLPQSSTAVRLG